MSDLSPEQFEEQFGPYGCRKMDDVTDVVGIEFWMTGWDQPFTVCRTKDGLYDAADCVVAMLTIRRAMPIEWRLKEAIEKLTTEIIGLRKDIQTKP